MVAVIWRRSGALAAIGADSKSDRPEGGPPTTGNSKCGHVLRDLMLSTGSSKPPNPLSLLRHQPSSWNGSHLELLLVRARLVIATPSLAIWTVGSDDQLLTNITLRAKAKG